MDQNIWEYDDFIFKGDELKGMTAKGKDKVKAGGQTDLVIPAVTPDGLPLKKIADNEYEVDAMTDIETINKDLGLNLPISEDYESLGGLIVTTTGKICEVGDEVQIDNIYLRVLEVDKMRVSKVFIKILEEENKEEE